MANDAEVSFDVYAVTVLWDGEPRCVEADVTGTTPLMGMRMLERHGLNIEVENHGRVLVIPSVVNPEFGGVYDATFRAGGQ